ncbi:DNA mismatch repair protein MutS [Candidatus Dojkabacteria bacterium]|uniref:DNA mismatch repair protein MutS n=1 Tax=Candidatus Dojkabacteria bacterium TaxID=2099670 RepID=A0A847D0C4_9BACT|nr:DNA mismatch repair protein MutS [Candidatus Dojkabacteria bacterium]
MNDTPMMKQFLSFKKQYPDKIVLFRMGDFFETFGEDAKIASKVLNITLTKRDKKENATLLAGFPHKAIDQYLPKFIDAGYCVVVVDQLEDPKFAKGIVKRGVTRIVTPGTVDGEEASIMRNSYLAAFYFSKKKIVASLADITTGEFLLLKEGYEDNYVRSVLTAYNPSEILILEGQSNDLLSAFPVQFLDKRFENIKYCEEIIKDFFEINTTDSLGLERDSEGIISVAMILHYISNTQMMNPKHISKPIKVSLEKTMILDKATVRNLELTNNYYLGTMENSLFSILNNTNTRMGTRLLYGWILNPLISKKEIDERLKIVEIFFQNENILDSVRGKLEGINDIERIVGKIGLNRVNARDLKALQVSLQNALDILDELSNSLKIKYSKLDNEFYKELVNKISKFLVDNPPNTISEGGIIREGYSKEVDELKSLSMNSKIWLKEFEEKERKSTGISSLKVSYNNVFGYYIEVTKSHYGKVPDRYIRKQTLVNSERFITEDLKEKEEIILNAHERLSLLELKLFNEFRETLLPNLEKIKELSKKISYIDVLSNFAYTAKQLDYVKPEISEMGENDGIIHIEKGRHPIIESFDKSSFISNNTDLSSKEGNMCILTGPNMAGKSTYIRQVATIVLMAQIGSFVPANKAEISIVDRIFTRVGASDDLSRGRSTFMVEMDEAANIINNASKYSLIVLDEVGRGTSTYDGVSIAWALAEYIIRELKARTLFATHYHELLRLAEKFPSEVKNYNVLVEEDIEKGEVIFLRKIIEGGTDRSYGIYVAKMAGLPEKIIKRANQILEGFEQNILFPQKNTIREGTFSSKEQNRIISNAALQYPLFSAKNSVIENEIQKIDTDNLTPLEALKKIVEWKKKI